MRYSTDHVDEVLRHVIPKLSASFGDQVVLKIIRKHVDATETARIKANLDNMKDNPYEKTIFLLRSILSFQNAALIQAFSDFFLEQHVIFHELSACFMKMALSLQENDVDVKSDSTCLSEPYNRGLIRMHFTSTEVSSNVSSQTSSPEMKVKLKCYSKQGSTNEVEAFKERKSLNTEQKVFTEATNKNASVTKVASSHKLDGTEKKPEEKLKKDNQETKKENKIDKHGKLETKEEGFTKAVKGSTKKETSHKGNKEGSLPSDANKQDNNDKRSKQTHNSNVSYVKRKSVSSASKASFKNPIEDLLVFEPLKCNFELFRQPVSVECMKVLQKHVREGLSSLLVTGSGILYINWEANANPSSPLSYQDNWQLMCVNDSQTCQLLFPPILLPPELGSWLVHFKLKRIESSLVLLGGLANHEMNKAARRINDPMHGPRLHMLIYIVVDSKLFWTSELRFHLGLAEDTLVWKVSSNFKCSGAALPHVVMKVLPF